MTRINLLPTKAAQKKESVIQQMVVGVVVLAAAIAYCWSVNRGLEQKVEAKKAEVKELKSKINQLKSVIREVEAFKKKKRDLNRKIDTIKKLNRQRSGPVKMMEEFTFVIPRKSWITTFREVGKQLTLEGLAIDGPTVSDFIENLRSSRYFHSVQLVQVQQVSEGGKKMKRFNINCRVNYTPAGKA